MMLRERVANRQYWQQTPLQELLLGKLYPHDGHCNASRREPMGCLVCSCHLRKRGKVTDVIEGDL